MALPLCRCTAVIVACGVGLWDHHGILKKFPSEECHDGVAATGGLRHAPEQAPQQGAGGCGFPNVRNLDRCRSDRQFSVARGVPL
ncbi:hypothetical protein BU16DRAFT_524250 [Lophium mytilinum]|uniref:Uncharacterized protein n=1 Tax=Lophium mytilinum TaxID=390894 RepID=A0A6A6R626_9PEZI|nr:hypothetical protein BU16DRAFT_524250 [Lophium mytilinum]